MASISRSIQFAPTFLLPIAVAVVLAGCPESEVDDPLEGQPTESGDDDPIREHPGGPGATPTVDYQGCRDQLDCPYQNSVCLTTLGPGFCTVPCEAHSDCPDSGWQVCEGGVCLPSCADDSQCPSGYSCRAGGCVGVADDTSGPRDEPSTDEPPTTDDPDPDPVDNPDSEPDEPDDPYTPPSSSVTNFGARCSTATDCLNGDSDPSVVCLSEIAGGYCTLECMVDDDCGVTASCGIELGLGQWFCGLDCSDDVDCGRSGELACDIYGPTPVCNGVDAVTPPDDDPVVSGALGESCDLDFDCSVASLFDNRCFTDAQGWTDGYCVAYGCLTDADCGPNGFCGNSGEEGNGVCIETCSGACERIGYDCLMLDDTLGLCLPPLPDPELDPPNVGIPCAISDQCTMGNGYETAPFAVCIPPAWPDGAEGLPDGYCTAVDCSLGGGDCGIGNTCVLIPSDDPTLDDLYLCMESCADIGMQSTCRSGYLCYDDGYGQGVCWGE